MVDAVGARKPTEWSPIADPMGKTAREIRSQHARFRDPFGGATPCQSGLAYLPWPVGLGNTGLAAKWSAHCFYSSFATGLSSNMNVIRGLLIAVSTAGLCATALAQASPAAEPKPGPQAANPQTHSPSTKEPSGEVKAVTHAILEEIDKHSELMANIEYLCDMIGPRLTGSPNLTKANQWTRDKFTQYGLTNAHLEPWTIDRAWTRGDAKGRVVVPVEQRILLESSGWSPSTNGPQRGPVVYVKAQSVDELNAYKGRLKGAWVILSEPSMPPSPKQPKTNLEGEMRKRIREYMRMRAFRPQLRKFLIAEGIAGMLRDSNKEHGLIDMTTAAANFSPAEVPEAFLMHRILRADLAAAQTRAGRDRDRFAKHLQQG